MGLFDGIGDTLKSVSDPLGILGLAPGGHGGINGTGFNPEIAPIQNPATTDQANQQYTNAQSGLSQQQALLNALQQQGGLQNQSNVYNQLQGVANGTGPNPALAMLNQQTAQNANNQAALMASQRGAGANPGLIARQAAMQGGNLQQQAAGQGAALQAQQSLGALGQLGQLSTNQVNNMANQTNAYTNATQGEQGNILGAINAQNQANVNAVGGRNAITGQLLGGQNSSQAGLLGGLMNGAGSIFGSLMNSGGGGGGVSGGGGGKALMMADGGDIPDDTTSLDPTKGATTTGKSSLSNFLSGGYNQPGGGMQSPAKGGGSDPFSGLLGIGAKLFSAIGPAASKAGSDLGIQNVGGDVADIGAGIGTAAASTGTAVAGGAADAAPALVAVAAKGGKVPAMVSPGERYIPPSQVGALKKGANPLKMGEKIPGKPKFPGNDYRNDTFPKTLESGGLVIPNAVLQSPSPENAARDFVLKHLKSKKA